MTDRALKCPQCTGPLNPSRFARSVVCPFCGTTVERDEEVVSAADYRKAWTQWNTPGEHGHAAWFSLGDSHWTDGPLLARGEISDVYATRRARWPTERALVKVLRDDRERERFDHEWDVLRGLQRSASSQAAGLLARLPEPIAHGEATGASFAGRRVSIRRWASGFTHTLEAFQRALPGGIDPRASVWVWRRILEALSFLHGEGLVHGAILPCHLLVEDGEHGLRVVGLGCADRPGAAVRTVVERFAAHYPATTTASRHLSIAGDVAMSARCMAAALGGEPAQGSVPSRVPPPLAAVLREAAMSDAADPDAAWVLRERLGAVAREVFGPPAFCPLEMPR
jgi:hypothetical protein